ncbi:MarR family winged helix-turn-helix transcriptional regulator [Cryptosporangium aurantiacum]|uniref:MarR family protein n=1 Tax=Cryptosporangium aurantiacum TaxID=134849 RepID=A0A1M7RJP8_9ACTN|nr:MarR family transcriptional regulator [Cryptosporangium aurantiacum]SHN46494.1 MarR family protein [Cryptosporangium aurantiacum]
MHTGNVVVAFALTVHDRVRAAAQDAGLDPRELAALTLVAEHDGCSVDWLRTRVGLTQSGTVRLVDRLAGRNLLRRGRSTGRGVPLHVNPEGAAVLASWERVRDATVDSLLSGLTPEQRASFVDAVAALLTADPRRRPEADATCRTCTWAACGQNCPVDLSVAP